MKEWVIGDMEPPGMYIAKSDGVAGWSVLETESDHILAEILGWAVWQLTNPQSSTRKWTAVNGPALLVEGRIRNGAD